jgi:hypothetical protein
VTIVSSRPGRFTVGDWLRSRTPPPPDLLRSRIVFALGDAADQDVDATEAVCLDAAERVLTRLFGEGSGERHEAADLLAADALVTYALEFAADLPERFEPHATRAMQRFGQLHEARG